mgnify:CR=1 FL=1
MTRMFVSLGKTHGVMAKEMQSARALERVQADIARYEGLAVEALDKAQESLAEEVAGKIAALDMGSEMIQAAALYLGLPQCTVCIERLFFKKAADAIGRVQKVMVHLARLLIGGEDGAALRRIEGVHDGFCPRAQGCNLGLGFEVGEDQVAVFRVADFLFRGKHGLCRGWQCR